MKQQGLVKGIADQNYKVGERRVKILQLYFGFSPVLPSGLCYHLKWISFFESFHRKGPHYLSLSSFSPTPYTVRSSKATGAGFLGKKLPREEASLPSLTGACACMCRWGMAGELTVGPPIHLSYSIFSPGPLGAGGSFAD